MDVAERLATYPGKILARDYAAADAAERAGDYAAAYEGFKALGDYEDSARKAYALSITEFAEVSGRGKGLAAFKLHDAWGVIDIANNDVASPRWDDIGDFNSLGLAVVRLDDRYGYINTRGEVVVPCEYASVSDYSGKRCTIATKSGWDYRFGIADEAGNTVGATRRLRYYSPFNCRERGCVRRRQRSGGHGGLCGFRYADDFRVHHAVTLYRKKAELFCLNSSASFIV